MYIQNRSISLPGKLGFSALLLLINCLAFSQTNVTRQEQQEFKSLKYKISRGMDVQILKDATIPFIHAQLVIHYREKPINPAVPYLTMLNIFDRRLKREDTPLLNTLKKLGNDFEVEHRPDFLLLKINFLAGKMPTFIRFLKQLFNYKYFIEVDNSPAAHKQRRRKQSSKIRFDDSIKNYWKYFFKLRDWRRRLAYQLAYDQLFPNTILGKNLISPDLISKVDIYHLQKFHKSTYQLSSSRLILKGNIRNPAVLYGSLERAFSTTKKPKPWVMKPETVTVNKSKKLIILNTGRVESPVLFWFQPVNTNNGRNPFPDIILNHLLFGYPTGRLYFTATRFMNITGLRFSTEMVNHKGIAILCNVIRIRYKDIEKFILLAQREQKKIMTKGIARKELLNAISFIQGRLRVNTRELGNEISQEIAMTPAQYPQVTLAGLNKKANSEYEPVIVIVGNSAYVNRYLSTLADKTEIIDLFKQ